MPYLKNWQCGVLHSKILSELNVPIATSSSSRTPDISPSMLSCRVFPLMFLYSTRAEQTRQNKKQNEEAKPHTTGSAKSKLLTYFVSVEGYFFGRECQWIWFHPCPTFSHPHRRVSVQAEKNNIFIHLGQCILFLLNFVISKGWNKSTNAAGFIGVKDQNQQIRDKMLEFIQ